MVGVLKRAVEKVKRLRIILYNPSNQDDVGANSAQRFRDHEVDEACVRDAFAALGLELPP
jgi:hypothetical protein